MGRSLSFNAIPQDTFAVGRGLINIFKFSILIIIFKSPREVMIYYTAAVTNTILYLPLPENKSKQARCI
jgi:hypothetical protein